MLEFASGLRRAGGPGRTRHGRGPGRPGCRSRSSPGRHDRAWPERREGRPRRGRDGWRTNDGACGARSGVVIPQARAYALRSFHRPCRVKRLPRGERKRCRSFVAPLLWRRTRSMYRSIRSSATCPTGTTRRFPPFPSGETVPTRRSSSPSCEAAELGDAQARRVHEMDHRAVTDAARGVFGRRGEQAVDLFVREDAGKFSREARSFDELGRVGGDGALADEEAKEPTERRELPRARSSGLAALIRDETKSRIARSVDAFRRLRRRPRSTWVASSPRSRA